MGKEYKVCEASGLEIKAAGDGPGSISGYVATFGNKDRDGDIIIKGAFSQELDEFVRSGVILARHGKDSKQPIATITKAYEDDHGLFLEADFHSTQLAQEERAIASERMARGKDVTFSIGYLPRKDGVQWKDGARHLISLKLFEASIEYIPANTEALAVGIKSADEMDIKGLFESALSERTNSLYNLNDVLMGVLYEAMHKAQTADRLGAAYDLNAVLDEALAEYATRAKESVNAMYEKYRAARESRAANLMEEMALEMGLEVGDGLRAGLTFKEHATKVLATNEALVDRFKDIFELRLKEGRMLSTDNEKALEEIGEALAGVIERMMGLVGENRKRREERQKRDGGDGDTEGQAGAAGEEEKAVSEELIRAEFERFCRLIEAA